MPQPAPFDRLPPFDPDEGTLAVVVETPKGSRNKYAYDPRRGGFALRHVLPAGMHFPFDFGFVPSTAAEDGDPLDVLLLMDAPAFPGCLLQARLIGVIEAEQEKEGERVRNDRLVAVAAQSRDHGEVRDLEGLPPNLVEEIEGFFRHYNALSGKAFTVLARRGPAEAARLVEKAAAAFRPS